MEHECNGYSSSCNKLMMVSGEVRMMFLLGDVRFNHINRRALIASCQKNPLPSFSSRLQHS